MRFEEFAPPPGLARFITRFIHGACESPGAGRLQIPPSGGLVLSYVPGDRLLVSFLDGRRTIAPRLFVGGQLRRERPVLTCEGRFSLLGVECRPAGFYQLFGQRADRATDDLVSLAEVRRESSDLLTAALDGVTDVATMVERIGAHLEHLARAPFPCPRVETAVATLRETRGMATIEEVARDAKTDPRRLRRDFLAVVGIPPKHLAKIMQLSAAINALYSGEQHELTRVALDAGYADHAHFSRDFRRLVGNSPHSFLRSNDPFLRTYMGRQLARTD